MSGKDGKKIKIAVLLTCYNRKEQTLHCVESLAKHNSDVELYFVITDDMSTDGTAEALQNLPYRIKLIPGTGSLYWNGGMRQTISYALRNVGKFDYAMLINDDVSFYPNVCRALLERMEEAKADVVVGSTENKDGQITYGGVRKKSRFLAKFELQEPTPIPVVCDTFNCNCVIMKSEVLKEAGNLDSGFTHSMGDYDYGMGISKKNMIIVNSKAHVGLCEDNTDEGTWRDTSLSKKERLQKKESAKGLPWKDWFRFVNRNYGLLPAVYHFFTPYIRILLGK